jgi:hypothetical protein
MQGAEHLTPNQIDRLVGLTATPEAAVVRALASAGFHAAIVGGAVRNALMGRDPKDIDVASAASSVDAYNALQGVFPGIRQIEIGKQSGLEIVTIQVPNKDFRGLTEVEIARYRTEVGGDGRHPGHVEYVTDVMSDLARRDFTCNAMALTLEPGTSTWTFVDPFGGADDMDSKVLVAVGDASARFAEDNLRIFRAFRFAERFGWEILPETKDAMVKAMREPDVFSAVSAERMVDEAVKTFPLNSRPVAAARMVATFFSGLKTRTAKAIVTAKIRAMFGRTKVSRAAKDFDAALAVFEGHATPEDVCRSAAAVEALESAMRLPHTTLAQALRKARAEAVARNPDQAHVVGPAAVLDALRDTPNALKHLAWA